MEIRRPGDGQKTGPLSKLANAAGKPSPAAAPGQGARAGGGDAFSRGAGPEADTPFWLIAMSADRAAGRRFLDDKAQAAAAQLEQAWVARWSQAATWPAAPDAGAKGKAGLDAWQAVVDALCVASEAPIASPQVVWQPSLGTDAPARGQYLFRAERGLIQLRPGAAGTAAEWLATVAHETFHHAQAALVVALYQGQPFAAPFDQLAALYRDARIAYRLPGPGLSPRQHAAQALEVGAWAFGTAIAKRVRAD